ncbi:MAG TPA: HD domain-containing protein [Thermoleophilia bacterium]|nr:HD domain-containing protein [Thermoleophilia bacterium]
MDDQVSFAGVTATHTPITELQNGQAVDGVYACSEKTAATDRNGKAYLRLKLRDASGEVNAIHFDPSDEALCVGSGDVVVVGGTYSVHPQYGAQVQIRRLRPAEEGEYDAGDLVAVSPVGAAELAERLAALVDSVSQPHVRALLERAFDGSREPGATFAVAPAAVRNHHAYRRGLLEHSLIVAEAAAGVASRFASVDRDLVVAGALLHDVGKTLAYTSDGLSPQMTDAGRLHGEIVMGHDLVRDLIDEDADFPAELAVRLRHIIVAHHGMREKGSPVVPQTREAVIVHYCDDMTARIGAIDDAEAATPAGEHWSARIFMLDAPAYLGPRDDAPEEL